MSPSKESTVSGNQPGKQLNLDEPWVQTMDQFFPRGSNVQLPRPVNSFFICRDLKLLYVPIAKCACTSIKQVMVELANTPHADEIDRLGVHRVTDVFRTGAKLKDHDLETAHAALYGDEYYRFSVMREPVRRAISAYTEKFLLNRTNEGNLIHTLEVLCSVRGRSDPDIAEGISFREFVDYVVAADPAALDPHWIPQHLILAGVERYHDVFTMEQLDRLEQRLSERCGRQVTVGKHNSSVTTRALVEAREAGSCADKLPRELDGLEGIRSEDFMAPDLVAKLEDYFAEDVAIYNRASAGRYQYVPQQIPLRSVSRDGNKMKPLTAPAQIARSVHLYTKGFFTFTDDGTVQTGVLIANNRDQAVDFSELSACTLRYRFLDERGNLVGSQGEHAIAPGLIPAQGLARVVMHGKVNPEERQNVSCVVVSLAFGDEFDVLDISPLHLASAQQALPDA